VDPVISKKLRLASAGLTMALAAAAATGFGGAPRAHAATAACGPSCSSPFNQSVGNGETLTFSIVANSKGTTCPALTPAGLQSVLAETPSIITGETQCSIVVGLTAAGSTSLGQDWEVLEEASVTAFIAGEALSSRLGINYGTDDVYEFEADPGGTPSGLCLAYKGSGVTLDDCGEATSESTTSGSNTSSSSTSTSSTTTYSDTAWIYDETVATNANDGYVDLISGYDQAYSAPLVLTSAGGGALSVQSLSEIANVVSATQMWQFNFSSMTSNVLKHS
jgi:hypothetical protein